LQDYDTNMKNNRQFAHRMNVLQQKLATEDSGESPTLGHLEKLKLLEDTADMLLWGESVTEAMNRLRPKTKKSKQDTTETPLDKLTGKVDLIMSQLGVTTVYDLTKEEVLDRLDAVKNQLVKWEYKWEGTDKVYGPFSSEEMNSWNAAGYFLEQKEGETLVVRQLIAGKPRVDRDFEPITTVDFDRIN